MLFTITALTGGLDAAQVAVLDLQTGKRKILVRGGSHAHYVSSDSSSTQRGGGHLIYAAGGTLRAVQIDPAAFEGRDADLLADLVLAAVAEAQRRAGELLQHEIRTVGPLGTLPL